MKGVKEKLQTEELWQPGVSVVPVPGGLEGDDVVGHVPRVSVGLVRTLPTGPGDEVAFLQSSLFIYCRG